MQPNEIKTLIEAGLPGATVILGGEGCNSQVTVISEDFAGKSLLQQQRMVYAALGDRFRTGEIHALSVKSYTPAQWASRGS
ncbi:MAG: BolA family transcriptional regulator [Gammaproteobacteria bacterium]|nr:BolA family transcriptional regulator [Gammaproteobacteria bacterium]